MSPEPIDLGNGYWLTFFGWAPDRNIPANAERYEDVPDVERLGAIIGCPHGHEGVIHFKQDNSIYAEIFNRNEWWNVVSWEPLHIEPSVQFLNPKCCHGFIREGKWVNA